jgi:hypothetical protein
MQQTMLRTPPGSVKTLDLGGTYLSFLVKKKGQAVSTLPYEQVKERAMLMARLEKAPTAEQTLAKLYHRAGVVFEMNKYAGYFSDLPKVPDVAPRQTASAR